MRTDYKLTKISKNFKGVVLNITNLEQPLIVAQDTVYKHNLVNGIVLTESQLKILKVESEKYLCDKEAARLLAMRAHSIGEFKLKLIRKKFNADFIDEVIKKYKAIGALNDSRYAQQLADNILERKPCGKSYLLAHLVKKHIERSLADITVDKILAEKDQLKLAISSLEKRWYSIERLELETARNKAYNYLSRRGFSYGIAKEAFENLKDKLNKEIEH